jgi:hypothetical protein
MAAVYGGVLSEKVPTVEAVGSKKSHRNNQQSI